MPGIRITQFAGLMPELHARNLGRTNAQKAHNCLLWDGALRPLPKWVNFNNLAVSTTTNHIYADTKTGDIVEAYDFADGVFLNSEPFANGLVVGVDSIIHSIQAYNSNVFQTERFGDTNTDVPYPAGLPTPTFVDTVVSGVTHVALVPTTSISYLSQALSDKPVNRVVGISFARKTNTGLEEGTLGLIPNQSAYGIMFEGDIIQLTMTFNLTILAQYGITHVRLYRTIAGLDSGEQAGNELDTDWHLIATLPVLATLNYNDGGASTTDPLDLYLAKHFYAPQFNVEHFGLTESGWFYGTASTGKGMVSERYLHFAWPTENVFSIPEQVTDVVTHYDNLYIGTQGKPYIVALAPGEGEQGVQIAPTPFPERLPCLAGTMAVGPSGALYASPAGIVALTKGGAKVISAGLMNAEDILFRKKVDAIVGPPAYVAYNEEVKVTRTIKGAYDNGVYFGFVTSYQNQSVSAISKYAYLYSTGDDINGDKQFQQLVTMDTPSGVLSDAIVTQHGLTLKYGVQLYRLPLPGVGGDKAYRRAKKLCYEWKSKKFVFPGRMTFAAGKIVHDCGSAVTIKLYLDCKCVWQALICDCNPFRIPSQLMGKEVEIELIGTSSVYEVHIASSMAELIETE